MFEKEQKEWLIHLRPKAGFRRRCEAMADRMAGQVGATDA
jgi:hypothetical protein